MPCNRTETPLHFVSAVEGIVMSVKVEPRGNGALSWPAMQDRWRDGISNGNKPRACVNIRGSDLPTYIGGDLNTYYSNFDGDESIRLLDPTLTRSSASA